MEYIKRGKTLMPRMIKIVAFMVYLLFSASASADKFVGFKLVSPEMDKGATDNPLNLAINFGYMLDTWVADLSLIAELNRTVDKGSTQLGEELELNANAIYLLWKTTRSMYASLRAGVVQNEVVEVGDSRYKTGILLGASIGQVIGRTRVQIEYTSLAGDARFFGISLEFDL